MAVAAIIAGLLAVLAWFLPPVYAPIQRSLDRVFRSIAKATSWIVLAMVYFLFFTPLRFALGLWGKDPLRLRQKHPVPATFLQTQPPARPGRFDRLF
jgi:choline-glycine betaine transporter